jgi:hypothetical protein
VGEASPLGSLDPGGPSTWIVDRENQGGRVAAGIKTSKTIND